MKALRIKVSGRVQGVGYRYFAHKQALKYGISGYVKNLEDNCVEAIAQGEPANLDLFIEKLKHGPLFSHVRDIDIKDVETDTSYSNFEIL